MRRHVQKSSVLVPNNPLEYKQFSSRKCSVPVENKDNTHFVSACCVPWGMVLNTFCALSHFPLTIAREVDAIKSDIRGWRKPIYSGDGLFAPKCNLNGCF